MGRLPSGSYPRIASLDVMRGVAILGILVMNVRNFALPVQAFQRPGEAGGLSVGNVAAWAGANLLFEDKMIALLSLLFGAGLVLAQRHAAARGEPFAGPWFRRCAWLLAFGLVHAVAVWYGDILNTYAVAGALLFLVRDWSPRRLAWLGVLVLLLVPAIEHGPAAWRLLREGAGAAPGGEPWPIERLRERLAQPPPVAGGAAAETVALRGSWSDAVRWQLAIFHAWHVRGAYTFNLWRCAGVMLLGMALAKHGFFAGEAAALRRRLLALGYGVGGPLALFSLGTLFLLERWRAGEELGFDPVALAWPRLLQRSTQFASGVLIGLGHAALIVAWCERAEARALPSRLAAAGRLALTNYLVQSLLCTALFYGWGLGLFGRLSMLELTGVVAVIVALQLVVSPWWLARFRIGPLEWAWRSLARWRPLPWRRESAAA